MESAIIKTLGDVAPSMLAVIAVILIFLRYMEKRDAAQAQRDLLFANAMLEISKNIKSLETAILEHDANSTQQAKLHDLAMQDAVDDMRRKVHVKPRKRNRNP